MFNKHKQLHEMIMGHLDYLNTKAMRLDAIEKELTKEKGDSLSRYATQAIMIDMACRNNDMITTKLQALEKYLGIEYEGSKTVEGGYKKKAEK